MWHRYKSAAGWGLLIASGLGIVIGLGLYLSSHSGYRMHAGWGGFFYWIALGAVFGVITGITAVAGGLIALVIRKRSRSQNKWSPVAAGATGASIGASLVWVVFWVATAATGGIGYTPLFVIIVIAVAAGAAISAVIVLDRAEQRSV